MTIRQFLMYDLSDTETPVAAVAYDDAAGTATTTLGAYFDVDDSARESGAGLAENFTVKVEFLEAAAADGFDDPINVLRYNLPFITTEATEYGSVEDAVAAAKEALGVQ